MEFISDIHRDRHREALGGDILRLGVFERSVPEIAGKEPREIAKMRIRGMDSTAIAELKASVILHKLFFDSFIRETSCPSVAVRTQFGSEARLISLMYDLGMSTPRGFLALTRKGKSLAPAASESALGILNMGEPILAVDLAEHAYYGDFCFDKASYLRSALSYLRLSVADIALEKG